VFKFFLPTAVYVPSPFDCHPTHIAVTKLIIEVLRRTEKYYPKLWGYHVWGGMYGIRNLQPVDITQTFAIKQQAIRKHSSQLTYKAYDAGILDKVLIAVPGLTKEARQFAKHQGTRVFEARQLESSGEGIPQS